MYRTSPTLQASTNQLSTSLLSPLQHTVSSASTSIPIMSSCGAALRIPAKKRSAGGPFATGVPCNPETSVGLQAALVAPASAHLHVAEPVRRSARSITLQALIADLCDDSDTPYDKMTSSFSFCVDDDDDSLSLSLCKLCDRRMDDRIIYMSMGFCTEECRDEYFLDYKYRLAMAMEAEARRTRSEAKPVTAAEGEAIGYRRIFFTCDEV